MMLSDSSVSTDESDLADGKVWELRLKIHVLLPGAVLAVSSYLGQYVLASAGNCVCILLLHNLCQSLKLELSDINLAVGYLANVCIFSIEYRKGEVGVSACFLVWFL